MTEENLPQKDGNKELEILERRLTEVDPKIFEGIPKGKKQQIISVVVSLHKSHTGPLPAPETLSQYSSIIPNGADRIMQMAEKQSAHRIKMESDIVTA